MTELVACPECKKHLQVPEDLIGKKVQCPECKHTFTASISEPEEANTSTATATADSKTSKKPAWEKSNGALQKSSDSKSSKRKQNKDDDEDDRDDDDDDRPSRRRSRRSSRRSGYFVPHRGGMILAFGIIGLMGVSVLGIVAWVMGNHDLREIQEGRMDPEGEGMTQTGRILGMIATIFLIIAGVFACGAAVLYFSCIAMLLGLFGIGVAAAPKNLPPPGQRPGR